MSSAMNAEYEQKLRDRIDGTPMTFEQAAEIYEEKYEAVADKNFSEAKKQRFAFMRAGSEIGKQNATSGSTLETDLIVIGYSGIQQWRVKDDNGEPTGERQNVFVLQGVAHPDDEMPARTSVIFQENNYGDVEQARSQIQPLGTYQLDLQLQSDREDQPDHICYATQGTRIEEVEPDDIHFLPDGLDSYEAKHSWLNEEYFPEPTSIAELPSVAQTQGDDFANFLGADLVRIDGMIANYYWDEAKETANYTVQDDSVFDERDYPEEVWDGQGIPGLTVWTSPDHLDYAPDSFCDFYGRLSVRDNGDIAVNAFAILPTPGMAQEVSLDPTHSDGTRVDQVGRATDSASSSASSSGGSSSGSVSEQTKSI